MNNTEAFAGLADRDSGNSEFNRMDFVVRSIMGKMATMTLVQVVAVSGGSVDIKPIVTQLDGAGNAIPHGVIHNAPVWRYQAGSAAVILDPVVGDIGVALFAQSDISSAKFNKAESTPGSRRRFDWADAIYLGGVLNGAPTTFVRLLGDTIRLEATTVEAS